MLEHTIGEVEELTFILGHPIREVEE